MTFRLSCTDNTWPLVPHALVLDMIRGLGFQGVDLAVSAGRSHIRPEQIRMDIPRWVGTVAERLAARDLACSDIFAIPHPDRQVLAVNHPGNAERLEARAFFRDMLAFAVGIGSAGLTLRPGAPFGDEDWERSVDRSAAELSWRVEEAAGSGVAVSVEPHLGSNVESPERVLALLERAPGLTLRLDYSHFVSQGISEDRIEPLLAHARHFDCRFAAPGLLQCRFAENTIDFPRFLAALSRLGYSGFLGIEFAWKEQNNLNRVDTIGEGQTLAALLREHWATLHPDT